MGLCWLLASAAFAKLDKIGRRFELFPLPSRVELWLPVSFGPDVWVGMMGSKLEAKTIESTRFHNAMLVIYWCASVMSTETLPLGVVVEVISIVFCVYLLLCLFRDLISK